MPKFEQFGGTSPEQEPEDPQIEEINNVMSDVEELLRSGVDSQSVRSILFDKTAEMISEVEDDPERLDLLKTRLKNRIDTLPQLPEKDKGDLEQFIDQLDKEKAEKLFEEK